MGELRQLKGLGAKSEKALNDIGILTAADLKTIGPVRAFIKLKNESITKPSLNFLYAMVGALEDIHWTAVAQKEKARLIMELEDFNELEKILAADGIKLEL